MLTWLATLLRRHRRSGLDHIMRRNATAAPTSLILALQVAETTAKGGRAR